MWKYHLQEPVQRIGNIAQLSYRTSVAAGANDSWAEMFTQEPASTVATVRRSGWLDRLLIGVLSYLKLNRPRGPTRPI
jgi:hypothetical protein